MCSSSKSLPSIFTEGNLWNGPKVLQNELKILRFLKWAWSKSEIDAISSGGFEVELIPWWTLLLH